MVDVSLDTKASRLTLRMKFCSNSYILVPIDLITIGNSSMHMSYCIVMNREYLGLE